MKLNSKKNSVVIFGNYASIKSIILTNEAIRIASKINKIKVLLICDTSSNKSAFVRKIFWNIQTFCSLRGVKIIIPENNNINHPKFINFLKNKIYPDYAFSFGCDQIFSNELLNVFKSVLNNHNGILPSYRGWLVTPWTLYNKEKETGYCYHYMTEKIDHGSILLSESIKIDNKNLRKIKFEKAKLASLNLNKVIVDFINKVQGSPQQGKQNYFSRKDLIDITTIKNPSNHTFDELQHRMQSFGSLKIKISKNYIIATKFKVETKSFKKQKTNWFITSDEIFVILKKENNIQLVYRFIKRLLSIFKLHFR